MFPVVLCLFYDQSQKYNGVILNPIYLTLTYLLVLKSKGGADLTQSFQPSEKKEYEIENVTYLKLGYLVLPNFTKLIYK